MHTLHLYSYQACPFARRTRMTLSEKGLDYELTEIDVSNKPDNFAAISPYGKVPVLLHADGRIYESAIINEYLDESFPNPALMPAEPLQRAAARIWMDYCTQTFIKVSWELYKASTEADRTAATNALRDCLLFMEQAGLQTLSEGPYWLGKQFTLLDIQYLPFFQSHIDNDRRHIPDECERLHRWLDAASTRPSYQQTLPKASAAA
jgi:glutathione S-transferase